MLFCNAWFCHVWKTRQPTELTSVGGSLDSIQQGVILGVESNGEGTVHDVSIDLCPKICNTPHALSYFRHMENRGTDATLADSRNTVATFPWK